MKRNRKLPALSVVQSGTNAFRRWLIEGERHRLWTGERFGTLGQARLYADENVAALDCHKILKHHFRDVEPQRFIVPVLVEVLSDDPIEPAAVIHHLTKASRLYLNTKECGNGPGESLVLATIDWGRMEKDNEVSNGSAQNTGVDNRAADVRFRVSLVLCDGPSVQLVGRQKRREASRDAGGFGLHRRRMGRAWAVRRWVWSEVALR